MALEEGDPGSGAVIEPPRRNVRALLVGAVVLVLVLPFVYFVMATMTTPGEPTATRGPIQLLCLGDQARPLPLVVEIHHGNDSKYVLAGPNGQGTTDVIICAAHGSGPLSDGSAGGAVGPPRDPSLSLDQVVGVGMSDTDRLFAGRVGPTVARVEATLASGTTIDAKVSNGYYLVWSLTLEDVVRITAFDASGAVVRSIKDANGLLPPH